MKIKTISLSVDELSTLLSIDDADTRRQAVETLREVTADPKNIDADRYADSHPAVRALVKKVSRRVEASRRRAERKQAKEAEKATKKMIRLEMNDTMVKRLLWLRQHLFKTLDRLSEAMKEQVYSPKNLEMAELIDNVSLYVSRYVGPMMDAAAAYMRTPRRLRPAVMDVPLG